MANKFKPVTTRVVSFGALVKRQWGSEFTKPDVTYVFSNGRQFLSTDRGTTGIYKKP